MPQSNYRPRRSCLYMPGANTRALEKAKTLKADMLILDLEDAVVPEAKVDARQIVADAVAANTYGTREVVVRVNSLDSVWGADDLKAAVAAKPNGVLIPKVCSATEVMAIDNALSQAGADQSIGLWVMMEMPLAILNAGEIAAMASSTRLTGMVVGTNDLAKEMSVNLGGGRHTFQYSLQKIVLAAKAYGLAVIDGVYNDFTDAAGLRQECEQGRMLGFDGKTLIHPAQLNDANQIFSPDSADVEQAKAIIAAFALPENAEKGVITVNGKMTERLHLQQAEGLVAVAEAIAALE